MSNFIISITFLVLINPLTIIIHETGHLCLGKLVGVNPRRMNLGSSGNKLFSLKLFNIKIVANAPINGGFAYCSYPDLKFFKLKKMIIVSGGFLFNLLFAGATYLVFGFHLAKEKPLILSDFVVLSNVLMAGLALVPYSTNLLGVKQFSDGMYLLRIPFMTKKEIEQHANTEEFIRANDLLEEKKFTEGIEIYKTYKQKSGNILFANLNSAIAYNNMGQYETALNLLNDLIPESDVEYKQYKAHIFNALAWTHLLLNDLESADKYSEIVIKLNNKLREFCGTRAAVLIEQGEIKTGIALLENTASILYVNAHTLTAAVYLAYGYHKVGDQKKSDLYLKFLDENKADLDFDIGYLFERLNKNTTVR